MLDCVINEALIEICQNVEAISDQQHRLALFLELQELALLTSVARSLLASTRKYQSLRNMKIKLNKSVHWEHCHSQQELPMIPTTVSMRPNALPIQEWSSCNGCENGAAPIVDQYSG